MSRLLTVVLAGSLSCGCGAEGEEPSQPQGTTDSSVRDTRPFDGIPDLREDGEEDPDTRPVSDSTTGKETSTPPPIEDTAFVEDYGPPAPGTHVERTIGPEGGEIAGGSGTPLDGVKLVVPKGALSSTILFALDLGAPVGGPLGATAVSPFVRVGPDGVSFAAPAQLTLPWKTAVSSPQIALVARIGFAWGSLHDPTGTATTITALMRRTSGAQAVLLDLTTMSPVLAAKSPEDAGVGATVFLEGTKFGVAQVWRPTPFVSSVRYGGVVAETLGWADNSIAIRVPAGADGGAVNVETPGGVALIP